MSEPGIPTIDLRPWLSGDAWARRETAASVDAALRAAGFLLVTGHGVDPALRTAIRDAARGFFRLPAAAKKPYAVEVGGRGWLGPGAEANGGAEGTRTPRTSRSRSPSPPRTPPATRRSTPSGSCPTPGPVRHPG